MRALRMLIVSLVLVAACSTSSVAAEPLSSTELQQAVGRWSAEVGAPGMVAQIVDVNGVVAEGANGFDVHTPTVWGSVSKQLTAATVVGLGIDRTRPVVEVVPQSRGMLVDPSVTVDDLVHHTSGLPHDITVTDDWSRRGSATDAVASIAAPDGTSQRGTFRYSSLNICCCRPSSNNTQEGPLPTP